MVIEAYLEAKRKEVDAFLESILRGDNIVKGDCPGVLRDAMNYSIFAGGKRIRPILAIASYEAVGGQSTTILPVASALELIHTYSLIHDDLPAMDNDDLRRGRPTSHKVFGEAVAILAGDALLTEAFHLLVSEGLDRVSPDTRIRLIREIADASGACGMVGGQTVDILSEGKGPDKNILYYIHTKKTGALIKASVRVGAILAGASDDELYALTKYGEAMGLAFQIVDDILNVTGTKEEIGKSVGSDFSKGKKTYPGIYGLEESINKAGSLTDSAIDSIRILGESAESLREIARYIVRRRS